MNNERERSEVTDSLLKCFDFDVDDVLFNDNFIQSEHHSGEKDVLNEFYRAGDEEENRYNCKFNLDSVLNSSNLTEIEFQNQNLLELKEETDKCFFRSSHSTALNSPYSRHIDLDGLLSSPNVLKKEIYTTSSNLNSEIITESKNYDVNDLTLLQEKDAFDKTCAESSNQRGNCQLSECRKFIPKTTLKCRSKPLIDLRKVSYSLQSSENGLSSKELDNTETVYFATHPAVKPYPRKSTRKNSFNLSRKFRETRSIDDPASEDSELKPKLITFPIGENGCSVSFPLSADIDVSSFTSKVRRETSENVDAVNELFENINIPFYCGNTSLKINGSESNLPKARKDLNVQNNSKCSSNFKRSKGVVNNGINLKNIIKIEIYTKPPKKMVITKCHSTLEREANKDATLRDSFTEGGFSLSDFMVYLKANISNVPDDVIKKLRFPYHAVKRSCLTRHELCCVKKQAELLTWLRESKKAHLSCNTLNCSKCKSIAEGQRELTELQTWNGTSSLSAASASSSSLTGGCPDIKSKKRFLHGNYQMDNKTNCSQSELKTRDCVVLSVDEGPSTPVLQDGRETSTLVGSIEDSKQWKEAMLFHERTHYLLKYLRSKRSDLQGNPCNCQDNCGSFLSCICLYNVSTCKECKCTDCKNIFKVFADFNIDLISLRTDDCLLQGIYDFSVDELDCKLKKMLKTPCCNIPIEIRRVIPNIVACPNCKTLLSYSWCRESLENEYRNERNHCSICCKCQPPLLSHCYLCEMCTLSTINGKCMECDEEKVYFGLGLG